jgi:hypothetical protein
MKEWRAASEVRAEDLQGERPMNGLGWFLLAAAALLLALGYALWVRARRVEETAVYHATCPHCRGRLSYRARQAGAADSCPRCLKRIIYPRVAPAPWLPWWK